MNALLTLLGALLIFLVLLGYLVAAIVLMRRTNPPRVLSTSEWAENPVLVWLFIWGISSALLIIAKLLGDSIR